MEGDDGASSSSLPTRKIGSSNKSGDRLGTKSSGLQHSSSGRSIGSGESVITGPKSSKKIDEPVPSVLTGQDTRLSRRPHPLSDDRGRQVSAAVSSGLKSGGSASSLQRSNATGEMAPPDINQSRNRMKSSTQSTAVQRTRSNDLENRARKSGWSVIKESTSREVIAPSQSIFQAKGSPSGTNAVAGPSNYHREKTERSIIDLTENTDSSQYQNSLALPSPSVNRNQPNRKTTQNYGETPSAGRRISVITPLESVALSVKSGPMKPHWQLDDEERAKEQENIGRTDPADRDYIKRISSTRRATVTSQYRHFKDTPKHSKSYVGRNLTLRKQGESDSESESDSPMEIDGPLPLRKTVRLQQAGVKAARKREWPQPPFFDPDSSDEDEPVASSDEVDELDPSDSSPSEEDQHSSAGVDDSDIEEIVITAQRQRSLSAEIEILPAPPRPPSPLSEGMMKAIDALSLSSVRMQSTGQLPFLRRNLRRGFRNRCRELGVTTEPFPEQETRLRVQYEYGSKIVKAQLRDWVCPLCELHGFFPTREMLACHLSWDHGKAPATWTRNRLGAWYLRLIISNPPAECEEDDEHGVATTAQPSDVNTPSPATRRQQADISSPFPFVTLSPPEPQSVFASSSVQIRPRDRPSPLANVKVQSRDSFTPSTSTSRDFRPAPPSSRGRSTTSARTTTTTDTTSTTSPQRPRDPRYPTPPPRSNPLGPAARPPYLPAKSEYGGPEIHYSCRPGGEPRLYDLLNTLPLEPYGVLAWDVLDREDEIYDSDDVKDEYKVMHALWGRWIVLNRNTFIKDYYKGTKTFIDYYWRMIHRAAGWDALRYWLLMLVVNRFITGAEVASLLKHYESLTGMDTWYD